jgi:hypothetical protein
MPRVTGPYTIFAFAIEEERGIPYVARSPTG